MPVSLSDRLVVAVASSALFDLTASDMVFRGEGEEVYRRHQREHENDVLAPGVAFPLVRRLLDLNGPEPGEQLVEVVLLSRNDPDTGLRVFNSIEHHHLGISRAAFVKGRNPHLYMSAFNASLFLSANADDVRAAVAEGLPAGQVFPTSFVDDDEPELRIAFDFDGIIADDSAEAVFKADGLAGFHSSERELALEPLRAGPLQRFFAEVAGVQAKERARQERDAAYQPRVRVAIVTARNAPAHTRVITTLREWGIQVDEAFFLGGVEKADILRTFQPHIFFDDQLTHIEGTSHVTPSVHVPFGVANAVAPLPADPVIQGSNATASAISDATRGSLRRAAPG
jgi:5'-nucleotidase